MIGKSVNALYFRHLMRDRGLSQRRLATMMSLDPSALTLGFKGRRKFTSQEAADMAKYLEAPFDEVLKQLNVEIPTTRGKNSGKVSVVGEVSNDGEIVFKRPAGERQVDAPPNESGVGMQALRYVGEGALDGAYIYYRPSDRISPEAIGRPCVCTLVDGRQLLATPRPGATRGTFTLRSVIGAVLESDVWVETASPVAWIKIG